MRMTRIRACHGTKRKRGLQNATTSLYFRTHETSVATIISLVKCSPYSYSPTLHERSYVTNHHIVLPVRYVHASLQPRAPKGTSFSAAPNNQQVKGKSSSSSVPDPLLATPASVWKKKKCTIHLMGTQHGESAFVEATATLISQIQPDAVFVELDRHRFDPTKYSSTKSNNNIIIPTDPTATFLEQEFLNLWPESKKKLTWMQSIRWSVLRFVQVPYNWFQVSIRADDLEDPSIRASNEYLTAIYTARQQGIPVILGDRDIFVTQQRVMLALGQQAWFFPTTTTTTATPKAQHDTPKEQEDDDQLLLSTDLTASSQDLRAMEHFRCAHNLLTHERQQVRSMYHKYRPSVGSVVHPWITERDIYMAHSVNELRTQYQHIAALVGMVHVDGIETVLWKKGWRPQGSWKP